MTPWLASRLSPLPLCPFPPRPGTDTAEGSFLQQFMAATAGMDADQRGAHLEQPPAGAPDIDSIHQVRAGA